MDVPALGAHRLRRVAGKAPLALAHRLHVIRLPAALLRPVKAPLSLIGGQAVPHHVAGVVEHDQIRLARMRAQAAPDALQVLGDRLGGRQQDDAPDGRAVHPGNPERAVHHHIKVASLQPQQGSVALGRRAVAADRHRAVAGGGELGRRRLGVLDRHAERHRRPTMRQFAVVRHGVARQARPLHCLGQFAGGVVASNAAHPAQVRLAGGVVADRCQ